MFDWQKRRRAQASPAEIDKAVRVAQRQLARAQNLAIEVPPSDLIAAERFEQWKSADPFPGIPPALLNSADIADYISTTGMLWPFRPEKLKSASYEVAVLGDYFFTNQGKLHQGTLHAGEKLVLPRNSIVFLTVEPFFRLPDYIALRHNLKIDHVYKGLLVGTGPLIDPGFVGRIALPLHNLTENDYEIVGGEGVIWIEFTKLSPAETWSTRSTSVDRHGAYVNFPAERTAGRTVSDYVHNAVGNLPTPASSSDAMSVNARIARRDASAARSWVRNISIGASLAVVAIVVGLMIYFIDVQKQLGELRVEITHLQSTSAPN